MIILLLIMSKKPYHLNSHDQYKNLSHLNPSIQIQQEPTIKKHFFSRFRFKEMNKNKQTNVYRPAQSLQSMVKIKYNNMKISKNPTPLQQQSSKRKLRSSSRHSPQDRHASGTSSDEKAIQQIQKQFDNQQSSNGPKSTAPIHEELKPGVLESALCCMRTRRTRYDDLAKTKFKDVVRESVTKEILEQVVSAIVTPIIQEVKLEPPEPKYESEQLMTPVKQQLRNLRADQNLVLMVSRRSGRRQKKNGVNQVPFRKFQDSFEQKIVMMINRIYQKKGNEKDIELFIEKLHKMTMKQLYNPYVISGVQTMLKLLERPILLQTHHVPKFSQELKRVSTRIWEELGKTEDYEEVMMEERRVDWEEFRPKFIRKVYKMLLETKKYGFKEAQEKSFSISDSFFSNCNSHSREEDFLSFFREQKFLIC